MLIRISVVSVLLFVLTTVFAQQQCQEIEVLYPKADSIIDRTKEQASTYLILGNTNENNNNKSKLTKVSLLHLNDKNQEIIQDIWTGQDELLKVSAIQQDLNKIKSKDLPNTFWFRIFAQLYDGTQCQYESGKFKITATNI
ncbi:hypothetical protein INT46_009163 [Mucor plumbeus]|uniref:Uncharacterized protein n=1 Tax=Mucor plumbeus TaxID=97098 RepID=A0A8H7R2D4_9FUNG|nr:hypothetical protein INT46_009163 [Mucor plumbeus]